MSRYSYLYSLDLKVKYSNLTQNKKIIIPKKIRSPKTCTLEVIVGAKW